MRPGFHCRVWGGDLHSTQGCVRKKTLSCKVGMSSLEGAGVALGCSGKCRPAWQHRCSADKNQEASRSP